MNFTNSIDQNFSMDENEQRANLYKQFNAFEDDFFSNYNSFSQSNKNFENDSSLCEAKVRNIPIKVMDKGESDEKTNQERIDEPGGVSNLNNNQNCDSSHFSFSNETVSSNLQPKVVRIPITIESNEKSLSSQNNSFSDFNSQSSDYSQSSKIFSKTRSNSPSPIRDDLNNSVDCNQNNINSIKNSVVHNIPITLEGDLNLNKNFSVAHPVSKNYSQSQKQASLPGQPSSTSKKVNTANVNSLSSSSLAPNLSQVTCVPVQMEQSKEFKSSEKVNQAVKPAVSSIVSKIDPLVSIKEIDNEINALKQGVDLFNGDERLYRWLDEMLTRCMLKLDNIVGEGRDDVKQARKASLALIDKTLATLEEKVKETFIYDENNEIKDTKEISKTADQAEKINTEEKQLEGEKNHL